MNKKEKAEKKPKKKKRYSKLWLGLCKFFVWPGIFLAYHIKYHYAKGVKNRKIKGRALLACNHTSFFDGFIMNMAWIRRVIHILTTKEAFKGFVGFHLRHTGAIMIDRDIMDIEAFKSAIEHLKEDRIVVVMPEGRISETRRLQPFKTGIFLMALKGNAPVYPVYFCRPKIFHTTHMYIGKPITPEDVKKEAEKTGEKPINVLTRLTYEVMLGFETEYYAMLAKKEAKKKQRWEYIQTKSGDRIRVKRNGYYHYGIYISENEIIHFSGPEGDAISEPDKVEIRSSTLEFFLSGGNLEVKVCRYNERRKLYNPDEIITRARNLIGEKGYDVIKNNCEHFVNFCATGFKTSATDALPK